ncbi:cell division protein FtsQ/DivIB [Lacticaseibacillus baoqingensis]|uniref:Cell division protein DivIB n=1 Tax=Lacticaseibacillus baoqingensis TaxID=2486013 RepID=A0ABW4E336_9LACO|nr:cell division protein FtsQ/DivIB [Lacticaseibacillus baoqingensis]
MAWFKKSKTQDPLTPWEAYQAKQKAAGTKRKPLPLPHLSSTRQTRRRRNLALILTPLVILALFFGYMLSPLAKVDTISVAGEKTVAAQSVIDASKLTRSQVILDLLWHQQRVATRVKKRLPQVHTLQVQVHGFNQVTLNVKEYAPLGYWQQADGYHVLLASGKVVPQATTTPKSTYPIFTGFKRAEVFKLAQAVQRFPTAVRHAVSEVKATRGDANPYQITISMTDGNLVVADSRTVAKKIKYYPKLLAKVTKKGTIDLEVGAFFTPY